ncbi:MAG: hypothetical protein A2516_10580 [Alphaproteobacteria bacterium RIFOXYD12_FULL_60_8]|nr:MAG: hypothetical protein A2516_10580 [Alphaproteobacteria bacterium RIFOXYD12_FULL_60_8]
MVSGGISRSLKKQHIGGPDSPYDEKWLQTLLHRHPTCLPMDQIEPGFPELVPVCMELGLPCGYLDNLFMTPEGDIVIVEVKLFRNPQARREVVAQALDYASSLFGMTYADLEEAVLKSDFDRAGKPDSLYSLFPEADTLEEPAFIDAVNAKLARGQIVVLVAGDGIRSDAEDMVNGLQSHAGFHFTFALVELAVFQGRTDEDLIVSPRTLAKTCMIERGIVRIEDNKNNAVSVTVDAVAPKATSAQSITSEQFFEAMSKHSSSLPDALQDFTDRCAGIGVYPEFRRSLNFKWDAPSGETINLGYITRNGQVWTDFSGKHAQSYVGELAELFGGEISQSANGSLYVMVGGRGPRIEKLQDKLDGWLVAMEHFQDRFSRSMHDEDGE